MPTFNDSNNIPTLLPEGDYVFCVVGFDTLISKGKQTAGSDMYEAELELEPSGKIVIENLIDHKVCSWKIDTFVKSAGVQLRKGEGFEFCKDKAESRGVKCVFPIGLRGWCRVIVESYTKDGQAKQANKIGTFYVDKEKLPARGMSEDEQEQTPF